MYLIPVLSVHFFLFFKAREQKKTVHLHRFQTIFSFFVFGHSLKCYLSRVSSLFGSSSIHCQGRVASRNEILLIIFTRWIIKCSQATEKKSKSCLPFREIACAARREGVLLFFRCWKKLGPLEAEIPKTPAKNLKQRPAAENNYLLLKDWRKNRFFIYHHDLNECLLSNLAER